MRFKKGDVIRHFKREMLTKEQIEENGALFTYEFLGVAVFPGWQQEQMH